MQEKLGLPAELQQEVVSEMVKAYVEGLCWVLAYYYEGMPQGQQLYGSPVQKPQSALCKACTFKPCKEAWHTIKRWEHMLPS